MSDEHITLRKRAFHAFRDRHPRYHGGFLQDCFHDFACDVLGFAGGSEWKWNELVCEPDDERWDVVRKAVEDGE